MVVQTRFLETCVFQKKVEKKKKEYSNENKFHIYVKIEHIYKIYFDLVETRQLKTTTFFEKTTLPFSACVFTISDLKQRERS